MTRYLTNCKKGKHIYQNIYDTLTGPCIYEIIKWCKVCGSVIIDLEEEGIVYPGKIMQAQSPDILKESR